MSGHSKWKTIKHKKEATDQKRGKMFSKLLSAISIAAKDEPDPQFNPRLRTAVEKAKENKVPMENIERAIKRSSEEKDLEELMGEAYGPEGVSFLIHIITNNKNRSIPEVRKIIADAGAKWAEPGSVRWAFENINGEWQPKFGQQVSEETKEKIREIIGAVEEHDDVQNVWVSADVTQSEA